MTPPRNQEAKIRTLLEAGQLPVHALHEIEVIHGQGCPGNNPRCPDCSCEPLIWWPGLTLTVARVFQRELARIVEKSA